MNLLGRLRRRAITPDSSALRQIPITAAAIRTHTQQSGSYGGLSAAMHASRATTQRCCDAVTRIAPKIDERATTLPNAD
ncbi:hypothetical protein ACIBHX_47005 [Nonomuraea sp. NPDC050536]|uniref:hypothetical protein n=1 Tax=Nonomuraea sp. NPDC050536 TaxID=3364366 RepID=UPI0037CBF41F